ncbi:BON domain-containing protein [Natroniella sp. ANB-PHB2]|uniref:BON domain-containing protein n=1 Tax=Natroniella sp. ANB-PHB2 TaxID=3384444 RepID=UPI0038D487FA
MDGDKNLRSYGLKVDANNDVVIVTGIVDTLSEKRHAEKVINSVVDDKKVEMEVSISTDGAITDDDVDMEVAEEIEIQTELEDKITAESKKGVVHLLGTVESEELRQKADKVAAKARGVTGVVNHIKVDNEADETGDPFHAQVRNDNEEE